MNDELTDRAPPPPPQLQWRTRQVDVISHICDMVQTLPKASKPVRRKTRSFDLRRSQDIHQQPAAHRNGSSQLCDRHLPTTPL